MPGLLQNALDTVAHAAGSDYHHVHHPGAGRATPRTFTAFENCSIERKLGQKRTSGGMDGRPCRTDEEESCNKVHATCARVPKFSASRDPEQPRLFDKPGPPCRPWPDPSSVAGGEGAIEKKALAKTKAANRKAGIRSGKPNEPTPAAECNARLIDIPYGLNNPEAAKDERKGGLKALLGMQRQTRVPPSQSVWGLAVHGKAGTFSFDSSGVHAADYIYSVPQGNGLPDDYYVCDSRTHPTACALIGGNLRHACAEWYDPRQCNFCEDHGSSLTCEIRGYNPKYKEWARVPIYPRDLLGEQYRGEFRDVMARPMWASINIPKWTLRAPVKRLPDYMLTDFEPMQAVEQFHKGPNSPPKASAALISESAAPDPSLLHVALRCIQASPEHRKKQHLRAGAQDFL